MNGYNIFFAVAIALIASGSASNYQNQGGYAGPSASDGHHIGAGNDYQLQGISSNDAINAANAANAAASSAANAAAVNAANAANAAAVNAANAADAAGAYGSNHHHHHGQQPIPYAPANTQGNTVTSSITYPQNKGEILIHRPAAIIVKRPPTKVLVNHPPLVVKPAPVVLHKPPAVVLRKVYVKHHPRPVKVEPVYVNVVKPPAEKYFVNEKQQQYAAAVQSGYAPIGAGHGAAGIDGGIGANLAGLSGHGGVAPGYGSSAAAEEAAAHGYQLVSGNQGLAALAGITGQGAYGNGPAY